MTAQFYDLSVETLEDGTVRLEQRDYCGEAMIIDLHPVQAAFIANGLPVNSILERIATLERRLVWMRDRFDECYSSLPSDMHERCAEAGEFYAWLMASADVATEFCSDLATKSHQIDVAETAKHSGDVSQPNNAERSREHSEHGNAELF